MMDICSGAWYDATSGSPCLHTQHLRNAICKVQRQKQRPTAARICKAVRQCFDVSISDVTEWLNAAVQSGEILLINNDGVISYREPRRNLQNFAPAQRSNHLPADADFSRQPECAWDFPPQYRSFRDFMRQPINRALVWTLPQPVPCDPYMQFGDQYNGWLGSFATVDPQLMLSNDIAQYRFHQHTPDHASAKCLQDVCSENWNQKDCSYGLLQSQSNVTELSLPSESNHVTSVATSCSELADVEMVDTRVITSCDEHRAADNSEMMSHVSDLTNVHRLSVLESPGVEVEQCGTESMLSRAIITEVQLDKVSTIY